MQITKKVAPAKKMSKLVLGFLALGVTALIGTGAASAAQIPLANGNGYGGNSVDLSVIINGSGNVVNLIVNIIFGS